MSFPPPLPIGCGFHSGVLVPHLQGIIADYGSLQAQNLTRFHYLDEVRFVLDRREDLESDFAIAWKERIIKAFQREKKKYPHCSMPKIVCISWKVKDAMKYLKFEHKA